MRELTTNELEHVSGAGLLRTVRKVVKTVLGGKHGNKGGHHKGGHGRGGGHGHRGGGRGRGRR